MKLKTVQLLLCMTLLVVPALSQAQLSAGDKHPMLTSKYQISAGGFFGNCQEYTHSGRRRRETLGGTKKAHGLSKTHQAKAVRPCSMFRTCLLHVVCG